MSYQLLIVDDEVLIRKALSQYIDWESLNCVVHATASNGKEAIKIIEETNFSNEQLSCIKLQNLLIVLDNTQSR